MRKIFLILLTKTLLVLSFYTTTLAHAQSDNFNYSTAVGLILYVDGGGHVLQRPDHDEPRNFFILTYGIIGKYAVQMQPQHAGLTLDIASLPVEEKILLINHQAQKLLFLGDHWIGDGERFSIMETEDYHRLKGYFAETRKSRETPTPDRTLENYNARIHKIWADNAEDFYREFYFPNSNSLPHANSSAADVIPRAATPAGNKSIAASPTEKHPHETKPAAPNKLTAVDTPVQEKAAIVDEKRSAPANSSSVQSAAEPADSTVDD